MVLLDYEKVLKELEYTKSIMGTTNLYDGSYHSYSDNAETLALENAINFIRENEELYRDWIFNTWENKSK